jgi:hypothetical protein
LLIQGVSDMRRVFLTSCLATFLLALGSAGCGGGGGSGIDPKDLKLLPVSTHKGKKPETAMGKEEPVKIPPMPAAKTK